MKPDPEIIGQTTRCAKCFNPVVEMVTATKHVTKGDVWVLTGFCSEDCMWALPPDSKGCAGVWCEEMGLTLYDMPIK